MEHLGVWKEAVVHLAKGLLQPWLCGRARHVCLGVGRDTVAKIERNALRAV